MKRILSVCVAVLLLLAAFPLGAVSVAVAEETESVVLNVKDFGAVGDGKTDDRTAIMETFHVALLDYMQYDIPVTVYFPEGQYGLLYGGMYIYLPRGYGNLTVVGDGADKSTIVYLEEWTNSGSWVALRIQPKITPESEEQYLHDITIRDLGVYDTDPSKHAWHTDKGDPSTEETHGFNIQYCVRAAIQNCKTVDIGDECFDMTYCVDSVMTDNLVVKNNLTGKGGGSLSVGDGSRNVIVSRNTVVFDSEDSSLNHFGIAVESLTEPVEGVTITDNTMQNINGWGVNIGAPNGVVDDVLVQNNTMIRCHEGGIRFMGTGVTTNVRVLDNYISKVRLGISIDGSNKEGVLIDRCVIEDISEYGVSVKSTKHRDTVIQNVVMRNARWRAIYNAGVNTVIDRVLVDGCGTRGDVTDSAVIQYTNGGDCSVSNSVFLDCRNRKGIQGAAAVINTYIQQPDTSGFYSITGASLIRNCRVNRLISLMSGGTVDGLVLYTEADLGTHALTLYNVTGCTVTNSYFTMPSRYAVCESGSSDGNVITNNVFVGGSGAKIIGGNSVAVDNVRATLAKTAQFSYRVVDGNATVMAPLDSALTALAVPAVLDGAPVTAIDPWAFARCESLTSVSVPDTLTAVGTYGFYDCTALATVRYGGLEPQRESIAVGAENTALTDAAWTYHWENHNYDNACDPTCNDCDYTREVGDHVYTAACDGDCNECGFTRTPADHAYDAVVTVPNCVDGGYTTHTCAACGDSYVSDETAALGHAYDAVVTAPDCVDGGYTTHTCTACGDSYVSDETAALGHAYDAVVTAPNCVDGGYTTHTCAACGDSYVSDETAALGHAYDAVVTAPDCVDGGYTTHTCAACGDSYVTDETAALGHAYDNACDAACNACDFLREVGDHVYDDDRDTDCNECGFVRAVALPGDANGDGSVNNRDVALLQQYINGWDVTLDEATADANGDGSVNNRDVALLQQYINGWSVELK